MTQTIQIQPYSVSAKRSWNYRASDITLIVAVNHSNLWNLISELTLMYFNYVYVYFTISHKSTSKMSSVQSWPVSCSL